MKIAMLLIVMQIVINSNSAWADWDNNWGFNNNSNSNSSSNQFGFNTPSNSNFINMQGGTTQQRVNRSVNRAQNTFSYSQPRRSSISYNNLNNNWYVDEY